MFPLSFLKRERGEDEPAARSWLQHRVALPHLVRHGAAARLPSKRFASLAARGAETTVTDGPKTEVSADNELERILRTHNE